MPDHGDLTHTYAVLHILELVIIIAAHNIHCTLSVAWQSTLKQRIKKRKHNKNRHTKKQTQTASVSVYTLSWRLRCMRVYTSFQPPDDSFLFCLLNL